MMFDLVPPLIVIELPLVKADAVGPLQFSPLKQVWVPPPPSLHPLLKNMKLGVAKLKELPPTEPQADVFVEKWNEPLSEPLIVVIDPDNLQCRDD